jgi:drug/metabolite transporter (DMT)-like permease
LWLWLGLGAALGDTAIDVVTKRFFAHLPPYGMAVARLSCGLPFLLVMLWVITWPRLDLSFFLLVAAMLPLEIAAYLLYMKALKVCHLSLCVPFLAFTPAFLIVTGWLFLGESLSLWGIWGTLLIAGGSYLLGLAPGRMGLLAPFKALMHEPGARYMLLVSAIYSITAAMFKVGVLKTSPVFFGVFYPILFTVIMFAGYGWRERVVGPALKARWGWGLVQGLFMALSWMCLSYGMNLAPATYLVAVKRLSLLMTVAAGGLWLQERPILPRLLAAALMCAGVAIISLKG